MTYDNLLNAVHWYSIKPWLYDFYFVSFPQNISLQEFANYAHDKSGGDIDGWQMHTVNNTAYFAIPKEKNQTLSEEFADNWSKIEDAPQEEPPAEEPPAEEPQTVQG